MEICEFEENENQKRAYKFYGRLILPDKKLAACGEVSSDFKRSPSDL